MGHMSGHERNHLVEPVPLRDTDGRKFRLPGIEIDTRNEKLKKLAAVRLKRVA